MLVEDQKLDAVVSLPSGVFRPYAGVSTAILLFTKTNSGGTDHVWFYDVEADGWSLDDKRQPLLAEDKLGPVPQAPLTADEHAKNNLPDVLARWTQRDWQRTRRARARRRASACPRPTSSPRATTSASTATRKSSTRRSEHIAAAGDSRRTAEDGDEIRAGDEGVGGDAQVTPLERRAKTG